MPSRFPSLRLLALQSCSLMLLLVPSKAAGADETAAPQLLLLDGGTLATVKQRVRRGDAEFQAALEKLQADADAALESGPFSVTDKPWTPPSGDKRDYMSVGPYWWPNPKTSNGLPYVRRDGETNPERQEYDNVTMGQMAGAVTSLGLAWYFTGHEPYAEHAATLLRTWFLDDETRMNPHLRYGQAIPGRNDGRSIGIIDTVRLVDLLDPILLLSSSEAWTDEDMQALRGWFREYLRWLQESDFGQKERRHPNNHGTWYDVQVASFALFAGQREAARSVLEAVPRRRIARQIEPDGSQPHELQRTLAFNYSCYNLLALMKLATLAERVDVDLWNFSTDDGRSIRAALDFLLPYALEEKEFPYKQIRAISTGRLRELCTRAGNAWREAAYHDLADRIDQLSPGDRQRLLLPRHDRL